MGHANLTNVSTFFTRRLYAKGKLSIIECAKALAEKRETIHASEGEYEDEEMLRQGLADVILYLYDNWHIENHRKKHDPIIEPIITNEQEGKVFEQWDTDDDAIMDWGLGDEYEVFDNIQWKFTKGWRKRVNDIEPLGGVTH